MTSANTRKWIRAAAAIFLAIGVSAPLVAPLAAQDQPSADRPPKLDFTIHTLSNGLQVVLLENHEVPVIDLQVWYHVAGHWHGSAVQLHLVVSAAEVVPGPG